MKAKERVSRKKYVAYLEQRVDELSSKAHAYNLDRRTEQERGDHYQKTTGLCPVALNPQLGNDACTCQPTTPQQVQFAFTPGKERLYDQVAAFAKEPLTPWQAAILAEGQPTFTALDETEAFREQLVDEKLLAGWWLQKAESEVAQTVAKAVEYGATDLVDIGKSLARVAGREVTDQEAAEWGIFFYLEGKLSRWRSALERGDRPSDDTLLDVGVYARMAQRNREAGGWPFGPDHYQEDQ